MIFKPLDSLARIIAGQSPESSTYNSAGRGLPFFQGKADFQDMYPTVRMWCTSEKRKEAEPNDILISVRAPVGAVNICNRKSIIGRDLAAIRPFSELDGKFLYYFLKANERQIDALGTGSTFKAITQDTLKKIEIPVPPLDDQIRIAHLLGKVKGLIAQRKQHLQQLDDLLKSVFLEMFGDPVRNEKGWEKKPLAKLCDFENGDRSSNYPSGEDLLDAGVLFLSSREIVNFRLALSDSIYISEDKFESLSRGKCYLGDVLMVLRGAGLGKCCVFRGPHEKAFINAQLVILKCSDDLNSSFLVEQIRNKRIFGELLKVGSGSAQPQLTAAQVKEFEVIGPPIDLQNKFASIIEQVEGIKSSYQQSLTDLEALYGALSQQAFKGELDLSRVPIPDIQPEEEQTMAAEPLHMPAEQDLAINLPDTDNLLAALENTEAREGLISQWLEVYRGQLGRTPFSVQHFMAAAQTRLTELYPDSDLALGANDYEHIKAWAFKALAAGSLTQAFDDAGNRIELKAVQA